MHTFAVSLHVHRPPACVCPVMLPPEAISEIPGREGRGRGGLREEEAA